MSSSRTRSAETIEIRSAIATIAARTSSSTVKPELGGEAGGAHHPQRVVVERLLRRDRGAQAPRREVGEPVERVDEASGPAAAPPSR